MIEIAGHAFERNSLGFWESFVEIEETDRKVLVLVDDGDDETVCATQREALRHVLENWRGITGQFPSYSRDAHSRVGDLTPGMYVECIHVLDVDDGKLAFVGFELRGPHGDDRRGVLMHGERVIATGGVDVAVSRWRCRRALQQ